MDYGIGEHVLHPSKPDWGIVVIRQRMDRDSLKILFASGGERIINITYVNLIKLSADQAHSPELDEAANPKEVRYVIIGNPKPSATQNKESWAKIVALISTQGSATYKELVKCCRGHKYSGGAEGFVDYCINKLKWLAPTLRTSPSPSKTFIPGTGNPTGQISVATDSGIYVAVLLTENLMPVTRDQRYVATCARVNNTHVKIGKAKNFERRKLNYWADFDQENVDFVPIARLQDIDTAETAIKSRLDRYRLRSPKGGKMDWLERIDPVTVVRTAYAVLDEDGFDYEMIANRFCSKS